MFQGALSPGTGTVNAASCGFCQYQCHILYHTVSLAMPSVRDRNLRVSASVGRYQAKYKAVIRLSIRNFITSNKIRYIRGSVG